MSEEKIGMIDISDKRRSHRKATAEAFIVCSEGTLDRIESGDTPKGNVYTAARTAALMASKTTHLVLPHCHPLTITGSDVEFERQKGRLRISVEVSAIDRTGVEMEALHAVSVAALTIYDMTKFTDEDLRIEGTRLVKKTGGKSDLKRFLATTPRAAVLVCSDSVHAGNAEDRSGLKAQELLQKAGAEVIELAVVPDEDQAIAEKIKGWTDNGDVDLVFTSGGTGVGPRDRTVEVTQALIERELPGLGEIQRAFGFERLPVAALSRATGGIRGSALIINLPGSTGGVKDGLNALLPWVFHIPKCLEGTRHDD
jgi:molybdenum cofactor biosynthesis protein MoaC